MNKSLKSWLLVGCAAGLLALSLHSEANAQSLNGVGLVTVGTGANAVTSGPLTIVFDAQTGTYLLDNTILNLGGATINVGANGKFDPLLSYNFSATNGNAVATPFAFDLAIPITPQNVGSILTSSLEYGLTDGTTPRNGASASPFPIAPFLSGAFQTMTGDGIDLGNSVDIGTAESVGTTGSRSQPFAFADGTGVSPIAFSTLDVHISFLLSGGGDNIAITGSVEVEPADVPEPGTVAMLAGLGISGSVFALRRKRRA